MSFSALQQAVLQEATAQADLIKSRLHTQLKKKKDQIEAKIQAVEIKVTEQARTEAANQAQRLHQGATLAARADILMAKQAGLANAQAAFLKQVVAADARKTEKLIGALMELVKSEEGTCYAGEHHYQVVKKVAAKKGLSVAKETIPGEGGFMFRGPRIEMNLTLSHIADQIVRKHRVTIAEVLFS